MTYPIPDNEPERLLELYQLKLLDTAAEPMFDGFAQLAASIMDTPMAMVALMDIDRQWYKARYGVPLAETPRDIALCNHTLMGEDPLVVPNLTKDDRYSENPLVTGQYALRFYAGVPLITPSGNRLGTLCVVDQTPRSPSEAQIRSMKILAALVASSLTLQRDFTGTHADLGKTRGDLAGFSKLVHGVGHQLKAPLSQISELVDIIMNEPGEVLSAERIADFMQVIRMSVRQLSRVSDGILQMEAATNGEHIKQVELPLEPLLRVTARSFAHLFTSKLQSYHFEISEPGLSALADDGSVRQIAVNLLSNAHKYAPAGAKISMTVAPSHDRQMVVIEFSDTGPGIPEAVLSRVGLTSDRASDTATQCGLGLHLSKALAEAMGGRLLARNRIQGGATVSLMLPMA